MIKTIPVTQLKRLGSQAPEFDLPVTITKLDGSAVQITLRCKALRKSAWAKIRDARQREVFERMQKPAETASPAGDDVLAKESGEGDPKATPAPAEPLNPVLEALARSGYEANVGNGLRSDSELVLTFAIGWDLEDEFCLDGLMALEDEFGGTIRAAATAYDQAIFQGRLGN